MGLFGFGKKRRKRSVAAFIDAGRGSDTKNSSDAYVKSVWGYAITEKVARSVARSLMTVQVYKDEDVDDLEEGTPVKNHPFTKFLRYGNDRMSGFMALYGAYKIYHTEGAIVFHVIRNRLGKPLKYYPLSASAISDISSLNTFDEASLEDMMVTVTYPNDESFEVNVKDLAIIYNPNAVDIYDPEGISVFQVLSDDFDTDQEAQNALQLGYKNNMSPSRIFLLGEGADELDDDQIAQLEQELAQFQGSDNINKSFVTTDAIEVKELSNSIVQMPVIDHRRYLRDNTIQAHGLPLESLGVTDNSNRANIRESREMYYGETIDPLIQLFVSELERKILHDMFGATKYVLRFRSPRPRDEDARRAFMLQSKAAYLVDEFRKAIDLPPLADGSGQIPYTEYEQSLLGGGESPGDETSIHVDNENDDRLPQTLVDERSVDGSNKRVVDLDADEIERLFGAVDAQDFTEEEIEKVVASYERAVAASSDEVQEFFKAEGVAAANINGMPSIRVQQMTAGRVEYISRYIEGEVKASAKKEIAKGIVSFDKDQLRSTLSSLGADEKMIDAVSVSETTRLSTDVRLEEARNTDGIVGLKQWMQNPGRTRNRSHHGQLDRKVIGLDEDFVVPATRYLVEERAQGPGKCKQRGNNKHCHCTVIPLVRRPKDARAFRNVDKLVQRNNEVNEKYEEEFFEVYMEVTNALAGRISEAALEVLG